ncbi:class I SAM-dependent methyltransferase [Pseudooceanicola sp. C21-150M6]|uniref:class I SAM-dependent methyltransferase n=1 Tax=Pseudooceanicola sp. C21-150M6 TaxID=3434355 RepID=UPI003D7F213E
MNDAAPIQRPELTLPEEEAVAVRAAYAKAKVILEYGSGGSTVVASELPGKQVWSVESDPDWANMMRGWFAANPGQSPVTIVHADIGPTVEWGYPKRPKFWANYPGYPLGVWTDGEMPAPDTVLVDGRFRVGCALATAFMTEKPVKLLFDDYTPRKAYRAVEQYLGTPEIVGRMALFDVTPLEFPKRDLLKVIKLMCATL